MAVKNSRPRTVPISAVVRYASHVPASTSVAPVVAIASDQGWAIMLVVLKRKTMKTPPAGRWRCLRAEFSDTSIEKPKETIVFAIVC
jgi:hypothetical protein